MLDDDALTRLLGEAADSFSVPPLPTLDAARPPRRYGKWVRWTGAAAALLVGVLVVQSLTGGSSPATRSTAAGTPSALAPSSPDEAPVNGPAQGAYDSASGGVAGAGGSATSAVVGAPVPARAPVAQAPNGQQAPVTTGTDGFSDSAKIVQTGTVALIVPDGKVTPAVTDITGNVKKMGGYIADAKTQEYGDSPSSSLTIRMPVGRFADVVTMVRGEGKVDSSSTSGQDVTAQYADVDAQIRSLSAARDRFLVILSRANTIGETLSVQQRVDGVQQQIDQLTGRLRVLRDQSSMGTLTVTVSEKAKAVTTVHEQSGLSRAWHNAKHGFTSGVEALISKSGRGLLVLLVALVCLVVARFGWRFARRRLV